MCICFLFIFFSFAFFLHSSLLLRFCGLSHLPRFFMSSLRFSTLIGVFLLLFFFLSSYSLCHTFTCSRFSLRFLVFFVSYFFVLILFVFWIRRAKISLYRVEAGNPGKKKLGVPVFLIWFVFLVLCAFVVFGRLHWRMLNVSLFWCMLVVHTSLGETKRIIQTFR